MDTAPTIALKITKKFRSRSVAVAPGMNSSQFLIKPALRFLISNLARAISGAKAATGQPGSRYQDNHSAQARDTSERFPSICLHEARSSEMKLSFVWIVRIPAQ